MLDSPLLSTLIALAGTFLGLALFVQVTQEAYKQLSSSKSRSYVNTLVDFFGPHVYGLLQPGALPELQLRGPFQWLRTRPTGRLQPMQLPDLIAALERTAAPWVRRTLDALRFEAMLTGPGVPGSSPAFRNFLRQIGGVERGSPGFATAMDIREFLATWGITASGDPAGLPGPATSAPPLDVQGLLLDFRQKFLPAAVQAENHFGQLSQNVEAAYRRRNLRQTFVIGFLVAVVFELPFNDLMNRASTVPLDQAISATTGLRELYASHVLDGSQTDSVTGGVGSAFNAAVDTLSRKLLVLSTPVDHLDISRGLSHLTPTRAGLRYLLDCLVTTLLISFGAPFWNDLAGALLVLGKRKAPLKPSPEVEGGRA